MDEILSPVHLTFLLCVQIGCLSSGFDSGQIGGSPFTIMVITYRTYAFQHKARYPAYSWLRKY